MDSEYKTELAAAIAALQTAASISQSIISQSDKGAIAKDDLSPVTVADFAIQALLIARLGSAFPDDTFVGEEDASTLRSHPGLRARVWDEFKGEIASPEEMCILIDRAGKSSPARGKTWVFDPIDGTATYVKGQLYAINIGLLQDGKQVLGAVACPNLGMEPSAPLLDADVQQSGCILYAVRGHGAFRMPLEGGAARKLPGAQGGPIRFVTCAEGESALAGVHADIAERLGASYPGTDLVAWVLRWATLALGLGNATVWVYKRRDRLAKAWDHAGAMLLFEETGGKVTDVRGKDIDLGTGRKLAGNFGFVAAAEEVHGAVLAATQDVLKEQGHGALLL